MQSTAIQVRKSFKTAEPIIRFRQDGHILYTTLTVNPAPGIVQHYRSRVDLSEVERRLRAGQLDGVEGIFGSIWKGIKKATKKVGKALGVKKIVKTLAKVGKIPGISAIPFVGPALKVVSVGNDMATALLAKKAGKPKLAKKAMNVALQRAKALGVDKKTARKEGTKIYKLIIAPE
jgi:hypothetical protein